jgi:hypothetical protein
MPVTYKLKLTMSDGTQIDAGNIEIPDGPPGPTGAQGAPGNVFENFTSLKVDVTDATVSYASPTAHITGAKLIGYGTNNEEIEIAIDIPIVAGENVTIDASEDNKSIQVSATGGGGGGGGGGKYIHYIYISGSDFGAYIILASELSIIEDFTTLTSEISSIGLGTSEYAMSASGWIMSNNEEACPITYVYCQANNEITIEALNVLENNMFTKTFTSASLITDRAVPI